MQVRALASRAKQALKKLLYAILPDRALVTLLSRKPPRFATLEATTACNLACPLCVTHVVPRREKHLALAQVADVIAGSGGRLRYASFHVMGEPLLNPELLAMVRRCRDAGVWTIFSTNGMRLGRHVEDVLASGLAKISVAIDGADAADYARYRVGGDFDVVLGNVRALVAAKARRGAGPVIQLQTIMFSYNEDREAEVRALLEGLGADEVELKRPSYFFDLELGAEHGLETETARWTAAAERFLAGVDRDPGRRWARGKAASGRLFRDLRMCPQLERATVLSDGRVVACCMDAVGVTTLGDLSRERFADVWRGPARRALLERFLRRELELCRTCTLAEVPVVDRRVRRGPSPSSGAVRAGDRAAVDATRRASSAP